MDLNEPWVVALLTAVIGSILTSVSWTRQQRLQKQADANKSIALTAKATAEAAGIQATAAKTQAEAATLNATLSAAHISAQVSAAQTKQDFLTKRMSWLEDELNKLQSQLADGYDRVQRLESNLRSCETSMVAWRIYAQGLESALNMLVPAPAKKAVYDRLRYLNIERPADPDPPVAAK